jgi:sulfur-oxidizing protein SoxY
MTNNSFLKLHKPFTWALLLSVFALLSSFNLMAGQDRTAFKTQGFKCAVKKITGNAKIREDKKILIRAPEIAENGAEVGISVVPNMKNVEQVAIFAEQNATPLVAKYTLPKGSTSIIRGRVKLRGDTNLVAIVKANGQYYKASRFVKITVGGCGGGSSIPGEDAKNEAPKEKSTKTKAPVCK